MKRLILFVLVLAVSTQVFSADGAETLNSISAHKAIVKIDAVHKELVISFDQNETNAHSVIILNHMDNLEYKTRVMRYFGGMLVQKSYDFEKIVVKYENERVVYDFNRENLSKIVNVMTALYDL